MGDPSDLLNVSVRHIGSPIQQLCSTMQCIVEQSDANIKALTQDVTHSKFT